MRTLRQLQRRKARQRWAWIYDLRQWSWRLILRWVMAGLCIVGLAIGHYWYGDLLDEHIGQYKVRLLDMSAYYGLGLQSIYVEGQRHTKSEQLINAMQIEIGTPMLAIHLDEIQRRLQQIDWVHDVVVERQLPSTLHVRITERKPIALWQHNKQFYLVDETGDVIRENDLRPFADMILLVGEDAPLYAKELLGFLQSDSVLFKEVASAIRVGQRRWNIRFKAGLEVRLPDEAPQKAWSMLGQLHKQHQIFKQGIGVIDMRVADRVYLGPTPSVPALSLTENNPQSPIKTEDQYEKNKEN
jgi:cell division protein FtsQ